MALINEKFMSEVGLDAMPADEKAAFMEQAQGELELRVGRNISASLSEAQLEEFDQINGTDAVTAWLEENVPNFRGIVLETFQNFKQEIQQESAGILG